MAVDIFIKIGDIKGESQDKTHKDEIEVLNWSWGMSQSGNMHTGTGGGAGKVSIQDMSLTKFVDKATPNLMMHCSSGKHVPKVTLTVRKAGGDSQVEYLIINLEEVLISSLSTGGSGNDDRLIENITLNFAKVTRHLSPEKSRWHKGRRPNQFRLNYPSKLKDLIPPPPGPGLEVDAFSE